MSYILKSKKLKDGVCIWFRSPKGYYAHQILKVGERSDHARMDSMWAWINHLRGKIWWNFAVEDEFMKEVKKYLPV